MLQAHRDLLVPWVPLGKRVLSLWERGGNGRPRQLPHGNSRDGRRQRGACHPLPPTRGVSGHFLQVQLLSSWCHLCSCHHWSPLAPGGMSPQRVWDCKRSREDVQCYGHLEPGRVLHRVRALLLQVICELRAAHKGHLSPGRAEPRGDGHLAITCFG